jgi:hypothetical protein
VRERERERERVLRRRTYNSRGGTSTVIQDRLPTISILINLNFEF